MSCFLHPQKYQFPQKQNTVPQKKYRHNKGRTQTRELFTAIKKIRNNISIIVVSQKENLISYFQGKMEHFHVYSITQNVFI